MANEHLGHRFDIHGGGVDLVFPHHENEIAQYEAAHGAPFARHWMHNGMLRMGEDKMSKSLGNIIDIDEAVARWGAGPLRLWYVTAHHRSPLTFDESNVDDALSAHDRLVTFLRNAKWAADGATGDDLDADGVNAFEAAMDDDLNAPQALAALFELVARGNEALSTAESGEGGGVATAARIARTVTTLGDSVLGLGLARTLDESEAAALPIADEVERLLRERKEARERRDFDAADAIRDRIAAMGVVVEDRPAGARWYVKTSYGSGDGPRD